MQNKLSVVQVIDMLNAGGAERVLVTLSNILHDYGHKVKVITTVTTGALSSQLNVGIELQSLNRKWKWNPVTMYKLVRAVKDFDVIHVHSRHNLRYFLLAKSLFGLKKKIFYQEHHGYRVNTKATALEKKLFTSTNFIAVSESLKQWAIKEAGVNAANTFVLPNIVGKENNLSAPMQTGNISLVIVSNFVPVKNLEFAIEVFDLLNKKDKNSRLSIIGAIADKEYYDKVISLIRKKNIEQFITIITACTSVQHLLPQFHLAIHTSKSESGPLVLIEYMAQSLPFITYNTGEVANQLKQDLPEFIMQNFDADEWTQQITVLLQMDRKILQDRLQNIFEKNYSIDTYYKKCVLIYSLGLS
jgi:glycosyltransferase involved in cell wall biosynthesis